MTMHQADFNRFSICLSLQAAHYCHHQGECDGDVAAMVAEPAIAAQLDAIAAADIAAELKGYGAWDSTELADAAANRRRILWLAAGNITDEPELTRTGETE